MNHESIDSNLIPSRWFVVATRARMELNARKNLERQGYTIWLPELTIKKRRKGKWTSVIEPLFPGYIFTRLVFGEDDPAPIRSTVGCQGLVHFGAEYPSIPDEFMDALFNHHLAVLPTDASASIFQKGERVRIESAPFVGFSAVFEMTSGEDRARVLIDLLGGERSVMVKIDDLGPEN